MSTIGIDVIPTEPTKYRSWPEILKATWSEDRSSVQCLVRFVDTGRLEIVTATADHELEYARDMFAAASEGNYDPITEYTPPSTEQLRAQMPSLAKWRFEAMIDIYGEANQIELRGMIDAAVEALPQPDRTIAKSKRQNVNEFYRTDPLFNFIGNAVSMTPEQIDSIWMSAAAL